MSDIAAKVVPSIAVLFSNVQQITPLRVVLICRKYNNLGSLNPVPWAVSFINCLGYVMYGCLTKNPYVIASAAIGLPVNYFATSSAINILGKGKEPTHNRLSWKIDCIVLCGLWLWIVVAFVIGAVLPAVMSSDDTNRTGVSIVGYVVIATCMLYYAAPLSVVVEIIKNKDAAGLYMPMIVMNLLTSGLWSFYGFIFIGDAVVYAPNMFAVLLSGAQLALKFIYPSIDPTKLQRRMSKVLDEDEDGNEVVDLTFLSSAGSPEEVRPRAASCAQDILCADGTVGVLEFSPEEAATRNLRSSTMTSIAEAVLDVLDFAGPRRHPADAIEMRRGDMDGLTSPRSRRGSSFTSPGGGSSGNGSGGGIGGISGSLGGEGGPLARSPVRRMSINTQLSAGSPSHHGRAAGPESFNSAASRARRRSMSDIILPAIDEEVAVEGQQNLYEYHRGGTEVGASGGYGGGFGPGAGVGSAGAIEPPGTYAFRSPTAAGLAEVEQQRQHRTATSRQQQRVGPTVPLLPSGAEHSHSTTGV